MIRIIFDQAGCILTRLTQEFSLLSEKETSTNKELYISLYHKSQYVASNSTNC